MKKLLIIILLAISVNGTGQVKDSIIYFGGGGSVIYKDSFNLPNNGSIYSSGFTIKYNNPVYDTIKVLLLTVDTTYITDAFNKSYISASGVSAMVWCGYEVREVIKRNNAEGIIDPYNAFGFVYKEWNHYEHKEYLGLDKKPLSKNIVVWMSKTLN